MALYNTEEIEALLEQGMTEAQQKDNSKKEPDIKDEPTSPSQDDARRRDADRYEKRDGSDSSPKHSRRERDRNGDEDPKTSDQGSANGSERNSVEADRRAARSARFGGGDQSDDRRRSDRDHYRDHRDRGRDSGDYYRRDRRDRSRSPRDSYRPSNRDRDDRGYYSRDRRNYRDDRRSRTPEAERRQKATDILEGRRTSYDTYPRRGEREAPSDEDRESRTAFCQQLQVEAKERHIEQFFSVCGEVEQVTIVKDKYSQRSKGVAYVEFKEKESLAKALNMTGQKLRGVPIIVQLTDAEKNRQAKKTTGQATQSNGIPFHRLYVGNIHFSVTEEDLKDVFSPFGELEFVQLQKEEMGRSKGYGFVQFVNPTDAKTALAEMNGFEIASRPIRVGLGNDKFTPETTNSLLQRFNTQEAQSQAQSYQGSDVFGRGGRGAHAGGSNNYDRGNARDDKAAGGSSALDDSDVGGVNFNNFSRDSLMKKLARTEDLTPSMPVNPTMRSGPKKIVADAPTASRCIVVKNAYNEAEETDPDWVKDLEDDFRTECNKKFGKVVHVGLYRDSNEGEIYIKFDSVEGGDKAIKGLNGRYFGQRTITAQPVVDAMYNMIYPKAARL